MPAYQSFDWYETPLYYDIIFDADTNREADFLCAAQAKHGPYEGQRVLEPACGSGRLLVEMARRDFDVTGIDLCEGMLDFAKARMNRLGLQGHILNADMSDFSFKTDDGPGFHLAHCLVSSFRLLLTEDAARAHLECIAESLAPGGIYIVGLHIADYHDRLRHRERWIASRDGIDVVCNIQGWPSNPRTRTEKVRSRLIVRQDELVRRYETHWQFRTYGPRQMKSLLNSVPRLEHVATYSFAYDVDEPIPFDGEQLDNVLILRRR